MYVPIIYVKYLLLNLVLRNCVVVNLISSIPVLRLNLIVIRERGRYETMLQINYTTSDLCTIELTNMIRTYEI